MVDVKTVYVIGNEKQNRESIIESLSKEGYEVRGFSTSQEFYQNKDDNFKGLYIIDWNLPDEPGIEIVSNIRKKDGLSPIFMLSKFIENQDMLEGLSRGADDYIKKPYFIDEIVQKAKNSLKRLSLSSAALESDGKIRLLPEASSFLKGNFTISLTKREFIIFSYLYGKLEKPVSREELISQFSDEKMTDRNIDVHIFSLRKKIKPAAVSVETVWGMGYKLKI
jgi:DNA-binding response OmpR family regulator